MNLAGTNSDSFDIPAAEVRINHSVVNSRFVAMLAPVFDAAQARAYIDEVRSEFPGASHHVPAFILGAGKSRTEYCSDGGEPSGTAGKPVLAVLRGSSLGNAILVVTRYFGGTLLGRGGLVKAYTESAQLAVQSVNRARKKKFLKAEIALPYSKLEQIRALVAAQNGKIETEDFAEMIRMSILIPSEGYASFDASMRSLSAGKIYPNVISAVEFLVPVDR